eukprot:2850361-Amphidinium_carterae.1
MLRASALFMRALEVRASMNVASRLTEGEPLAVQAALTPLESGWPSTGCGRDDRCNALLGVHRCSS